MLFRAVRRWACALLLLAAGASAHAQAPADANVKTGVAELLNQYTAALESLDADAVKKVQPSADPETLKNAFRQMRSLEVDIDEITVLSATDTGARVSCRVKQTLVPRAGSKQTTTVTRVLRLKRQQDVWLIDTFER
ncbi:MAG: hypothetical protein ABR606_10805 [Vicinamibacterales bacterium]